MSKEGRELKGYVDNKIKQVKCSAFSLLGFEYDNGIITLSYTDNCKELSSEIDITPPVVIIQNKLEIPYNVQNYTALLAVTGQTVNEFAYVRESQGTQWAPGSWGGTYYPAGLYMWNGTTWIEDDTDIFTALENIVNAINTKQNTLISGSNIKTINGSSILGSGNLVISGTGTVTSVDMSVPTGLLVSGNPITTSGTLALSYSAGYSIPLTADTAKGVTAFGWGNHASAGYLTSISSGQVVAALGYTPVTNARTLTINGVTYDLSANRSWTIVSGVSSFNTRTGAIILTSGDVTTALGFTPYNSTNPSGFTSNVGTVTSVGGTGTVSGLTLTGSVTNSGNLTLGGTLLLTSGNVTTALGFTPYNSTNPSGYITSAALVGYLTGNQSITLSGDITGTGATAITTTIANSVVTLAKMANLTANSFIGNNTGSTAAPIALSVGQATAMLNTFSTTTTAQGLVPGSNSVGVTYFLRADGVWAIPAGGGGGMTYPGVGIAVSTGSAWGTSIVNNSADWNTAFLWGDHSSAGYITMPTATATFAPVFHGHPFSSISGRPTTLSGYGITDAYPLSGNPSGFLTSFSETDPIYIASSWFGTTNNSSNWNTAFGWGNHASVGYLTSITSGNVTTALGFTPYNSTNPSGFIANITGLVTAGTNVTITGSGTSGSPYVINSSGGGGVAVATVAEINTGTDNTVFASPLNLNDSKYIDQYGTKLQGVTAGTATAYTLALSPAITSYVTGFTFKFKAHVASGATATINIDGLGVKTLVSGINTTLLANALSANQWYTGFYDGTNIVVEDLGFAGRNTSTSLRNTITDSTGTGDLVFATAPVFATSLRGGATFALCNTTSTTLNFAGAATTFNAGGTPTTTLTANYFVNATASGATKTLNFGTGGVSGSTTNINFGSATSTNIINIGDISIGRGVGNIDGNTVFGKLAVQQTGTSYGITAMGWSALRYCTGIENTAFGHSALSSLTVGTKNAAFGSSALQDCITGTQNMAFGDTALQKNIAGSYNLAIGVQAMRYGTGGDNNVVLGSGSMYQPSGTYGNYNVAVGSNSMGITSSSYNVAVGGLTMNANTTGDSNTTVGYRGLYYCTTGSYNISLGKQSLENVTIGNENIGIGRYSGSGMTSGNNNIFIGYYTGVGITTGSYNVVIGSSVTGLSSTLSNHVIIADGQGNVRIKIDNNGHLSLPFMQVGNAGLSSGKTYKDTAANILANGDYIVGMKA